MIEINFSNLKESLLVNATSKKVLPFRACLFACPGCTKGIPEHGIIDPLKNCAESRKFGFSLGIMIRTEKTNFGEVSFVEPIRKPLGYPNY